MALSPAATTSQWGLLIGFSVCFIAAVYFLISRKKVRFIYFGIASIALSHLVYYILFLLHPGFLTSDQTASFSIAIRYHVFFVLVIGLILAATSARWKNE